MKFVSQRNAIAMLFALFLLGRCGGVQAEQLSLIKAVVAIEPGEASYVHYTLSELRRQIKASAGGASLLCYDLEEALKAPGPLLVVGRAMAEQLGAKNNQIPKITDQIPGDQGFILKVIQLGENKMALLAAGSESHGTNYALMELRQRLCESPSGLDLSASLDLLEKPRLKVRGLYLHQHWRYNYPWATWSWSVEDWKKALDVVAYLRVNLVLTWPHMDMLAPPLSNPEKDYLADFREVIDYAHLKRGIEIWEVEAANVLLDTPEAKRLPLERRDYYAYASDEKGGGLKNPGDPKSFEALMANREEFYRRVPNMDGYGYIDSDPGGWPGSPASQFVDLFIDNRKLIDRWCERPERVKLYYWMLFGWGNETREQNWRAVLRDMGQRLKGPWELLVCWEPEPGLKVVKELGYLDRATFFPYNIIEPEPSLSLTGMNFQGIRSYFEIMDQYPQLKGMMVNVESLLLQFPNLFYTLRATWSDQARQHELKTVLRSLALMLYPEQADALAAGWAQLWMPGSRETATAARRIEEILHSDRLGRLGTLGGHVFPDPEQVPRDLVLMLGIHEKAEKLREAVAAKASDDQVMNAMVAYGRELLDWQKKNGFFGAYGVNKQILHAGLVHGLDAATVKTAWTEYVKGRQDQKQLQTEIIEQLSKGNYEDWIVNHVISGLTSANP